MTVAHRITGYAPLAVHFKAVDQTATARATSNVTGVIVGHCRNTTTAGTGVLDFESDDDSLTYAAPGDSAGDPISYPVRDEDGTLTARTDANTGIITVASHTVRTDPSNVHPVTVTWTGGSRTGMRVTSVSETTISIDGGSGDDLPSTSTSIVVTTGFWQGEILYSDNGEDWLCADIEVLGFSGSDQADNITITQTWDSGVVQPEETWRAGVEDYGSLAYFWDFGDEHAIDYEDYVADLNYTNDSIHNSNESRIGPCAAHLFTVPGDYIVQLRVTDAEGVEHEYQQTITVLAQEESSGVTIVYVDPTTGNNSDSGLTTALAKQTFAAAWTVANAQANSMVKLKRGESYAISAQSTPSRNDITVTTYFESDGTDDETEPLPAISYTGTSGALFGAGSGVDDFKVCHLNVTGPGSGSSGVFNTTTDVFTNFLFFDVHTTATHLGFNKGGSTSNWGARNLFFVACEVDDIGFGSGGNCYFLELIDGALLGCYGNDSTDGEHVVRLWGHDCAVVEDCVLKEPDATKACLTMRGIPFNVLNSDTGLRWNRANSYDCVGRTELHRTTVGESFTFAPQDDGQDERLEHLICDGLLTSAPTVTSAPWVQGRYMTIRNKCDYTAFVRSITATADSTDAAPAPEYLHYLNNTIYTVNASGSNGGYSFTGENSSSYDVTNIVIRNCITQEAGAGTIYFWYLNRIAASELDSDYNLHDGNSSWASYTPDGSGTSVYTLAQVRSNLSLEMNSIDDGADLTAPTSLDFTLQATSDAVDAGDDAWLAWVRYDAAGNVRTTNIDMGAHERGASAPDPFGEGETPDPPPEPSPGTGTVPRSSLRTKTSAIFTPQFWVSA